MTLQKLYAVAQNNLENGWSNSRIVQFVFENANNEAQANSILKRIL